jgi:hypothetical protein
MSFPQPSSPSPPFTPILDSSVIEPYFISLFVGKSKLAPALKRRVLKTCVGVYKTMYS